jgi:hypothetical protein
MIAMLGCAAVMLVCHVAPTSAQIDEVRKDNWEKAKNVFPMIIDAAAAGTVRKAYELMGEFKTNLEILQNKMERAGANLHEQERSWLASTSKEKVVDKCRQLKTAGSEMQVALADLGKDPSSAISSFKSAWEEFNNTFEQLWTEFRARAKELEDRTKMFREECKECF